MADVRQFIQWLKTKKNQMGQCASFAIGGDSLLKLKTLRISEVNSIVFLVFYLVIIAVCDSVGVNSSFFHLEKDSYS